jgi:hypothetical protein
MADTQLDGVVEDIAKLRINGRLHDALLGINKVLGQCPQDSGVLAETIKVCILCQQNDLAWNLYLRLRTNADAFRYWEAEYLTRLKISHGDCELPELALLDRHNGTNWLRAYEEEGVDTLFPVMITNCSLDFNEETAIISFNANCTSCGLNQYLQAHRTFLIHREFLCPGCFARQLFNYDNIRTFLEKEFSRATTLDTAQLDDRLYQMGLDLNEDALEGKHFPLISRYLNKDYVVRFAQILIDKLYVRPQGPRP